jgi:hypothetical protein
MTLRWVRRGTSTYSAPYVVHRTVRGFDLWINSKTSHGILAKEVLSLKAAQDLAEAHKAKAALDSEAQPARAVP